MLTPKQFVEQYTGVGIDLDGAYGIQCVDGFRVYCRDTLGYSWATKNNYADGYWIYRNEHPEFEEVQNGNYMDGDWVIWSKDSKSHKFSHISMYYQGLSFGQNQGGDRSFCLKSTDFSDSLGALRLKGKSMEINVGSSNISINGHDYYLYRMRDNQKIGVLSAGLNKIQTLDKFDTDKTIYCKIAGANYYQMRVDQADAYGTLYGDISAPLNGVYQCFDNQTTTLYYDLNTGKYGDCTGVIINPLHDVFSPAVVYPKEGNFQYATMVGIDHVNVSSMYTFCIRFTDGTYALGITANNETPKQIATDFRTVNGFESIAFLDGGGSAQMHRGYTDIRNTSRAIPSVLIIYSDLENGTDNNDSDMPDDSDIDDTGDGLTGTDAKIKELETRVNDLYSILDRLREVFKNE